MPIALSENSNSNWRRLLGVSRRGEDFAQRSSRRSVLYGQKWRFTRGYANKLSVPTLPKVCTQSFRRVGFYAALNATRLHRFKGDFVRNSETRNRCGKKFRGTPMYVRNPHILTLEEVSSL